MGIGHYVHVVHMLCHFTGPMIIHFCLGERKQLLYKHIKKRERLLYLFWQSDCLKKKHTEKHPTRFLILNTGLNKKFKTSDATAAVWSDNIYGKWAGLAKQQPEKYVYHHDCLPFIARPPGRVLIRAAKEEKPIHSGCSR